MDASQLHQVLWNLCSNGLRYSPPAAGRPRLSLQGGIDPASQHTYLEIIDYGPGIDAKSQQHIFEPFYTTENRGSGLGLYIARELCQSNQARLSYQSADSGGRCFRIEFPANRQTAAAAS
jgi:two-component system sensor histidine kinase PilS (NtrC family)